MSDDEWSTWQEQWSGATGPLPDIRGRAKREARLHRLGRLGFLVAVAIPLALLGEVFSAPEPEVHAIGWTIIGFLAAMTLGYAWASRGARAGSIGAPREAMAFLERRLTVERRMAHVVRWAYAGLCVAFVVIFPRLVAGHSAPNVELGISMPLMAAMLVVTFTAPWWLERKNRPHREELARWKHWLDEQGL